VWRHRARVCCGSYIVTAVPVTYRDTSSIVVRGHYLATADVYRVTSVRHNTYLRQTATKSSSRLDDRAAGTVWILHDFLPKNWCIFGRRCHRQCRQSNRSIEYFRLLIPSLFDPEMNYRFPFLDPIRAKVAENEFNIRDCIWPRTLYSYVFIEPLAELCSYFHDWVSVTSVINHAHATLEAQML
jgi:hypothetical protein